MDLGKLSIPDIYQAENLIVSLVTLVNEKKHRPIWIACPKYLTWLSVKAGACVNVCLHEGRKKGDLVS